MTRIKSILLSVTLLCACGGYEPEEEVETKTSELISGITIASAIWDSQPGTQNLIQHAVMQMPVLPTITSTAACKAAFHVAIGGFRHGTSEAYFEGGLAVTRGCWSPSVCWDTWQLFGDFLPTSWTVGTVSITSGDSVRIDVDVPLLNPSQGVVLLEDFTKNKRWGANDSAQSGAPYFADSVGFSVEKLPGSPLCHFLDFNMEAGVSGLNGGIVAVENPHTLDTTGGRATATWASGSTASFHWLAP